MADRTREAGKDNRPTTVLDPLRPAVVVRRRVYDAAAAEPAADTPRSFTTGATSTPGASSVEDEDENGPPSSINVARALVARGFYALNARAVLSPQTARTIAEMYGWHVEDGPDEVEVAPAPVHPRTRSRISTTRKVGAKAKVKTKMKRGKGSTAPKPAKRPSAR